jgi:hypothetical protein
MTDDVYHSHIGQVFDRSGDVISAGFAEVSEGGCWCYGESESLRIKSAKEDTVLLAKQLGLDAYTEQSAEIAELKAKLAESCEDYRKMVANYQTLIIDLAPYLAPDQIHMVGSRTGNWFFAMEDGKYLVRYDPRDSDAGLWENTKPPLPN